MPLPAWMSDGEHRGRKSLGLVQLAIGAGCTADETAPLTSGHAGKQGRRWHVAGRARTLRLRESMGVRVAQVAANPHHLSVSSPKLCPETARRRSATAFFPGGHVR